MTNPCADLAILEKYYDIVRIVDPLPTTSLPAGNRPDAKPEWNCYHAGSNPSVCKNCVSLQAVRQKETYCKIEVRNKKFFLVTAMPVEIANRTVALELIKCVSKNTIENCLSLPEKNTDICHSIAKLNDLAVKDALTNIYNRRYIDKQLPLEASHSQQYNLPFSVVMTDIDYFKQINDQYGHSVGDEVLKFFAAQLKNNICCQNGDWVARYGGEEFLIVLINCPEHPAYQVAENLRRIIEQTPVPTTAGNLRITASFGVYTFSGQDCNLQQLFDKVDNQLYQAKQTGRNCTVSLIQ